MDTKLETTASGARDRLLAGIPVRERRLDLAGVSTFLLEGGDGPPLVLLHGPGAYAAAWQRVLPALAESYSVVAPDLPGHGASTTDGPLDDDRVIAWLDELIARVCPAPPLIVGQLVGGAIALRYAAAYPERVDRLVLVVPFGLAPFEPPPAFGAVLSDFLSGPADDTHDALWDECVHDLDALCGDPAVRWASMKAYTLDRVRTPSVAAAVNGMIEHFGMPAIPDETLESVAVPTSLIWGRRDSVVPLAVGRSASARFGWPLHVIENAGNEPALEEPNAFVEALRLRGAVLRPGDAGWADAIEIWNAMVAKTPELVLRPTSARAVAAAIAFARESKLPLSVKGGGHNIAGTSIAEGGLVLDMSGMAQISVDPAAKVAHVGPGCRLRDVDRATQEHGLATPLGFISDVGVAGLTLGGGLGYLTRRFGWTVDNLLEVEIVTASGQIRTASRHQHADLFWAVRGAGANLGVVTRFTFRLHEVGPTVVGGLIAWPFARADEILRAYRTITVEAPRELAVWLVLLHAPPAPFVPMEWHGEKLCAFAVCHTGDLVDAEAALAPIRALADPVVDMLHEQPYTQVQSYLDATEPRGMHYYWKTDYLTELGDHVLTALPELFSGCPIPDGEIGILHLAGALNEREEDDGAVGNRDARYVVGVKGMWRPDDPSAETNRTWVRDAWTRLHPLSTGRTYINFQSADEDGDRVRASYGANYPRLLDLKRTYDPENVFSSNRNVRPDA